jgi:hypothetical protein
MEQYWGPSAWRGAALNLRKEHPIIGWIGVCGRRFVQRAAPANDPKRGFALHVFLLVLDLYVLLAKVVSPNTSFSRSSVLASAG